MHFEAIVASHASIGEVVESTLEDVSSLALGRSKAVLSRLKECRDANDAAQGHVLIIEKECDKLTESVSFLKDRVKKLLVAKKSSDVDEAAPGAERALLKESLYARDAELKGLLVMVALI